jgi:hypothetical protein
MLERSLMMLLAIYGLRRRETMRLGLFKDAHRKKGLYDLTPYMNCVYSQEGVVTYKVLNKA